MDIRDTEWIALPDGTRLAARLFLPEPRPAPAVLEFLPYRRRDVTAARDEGTYPAYARAGIAGVRVDLRGTGDSEGAFDDEYSETELSDAEAVIAWIAAQPWSNGNVGMMGISWGGFNALQLAARRPPALKAVISVASTVDRFADDIHYKGGACMSSNLYWATQMLGRAALPPDAAVLGGAWRDRWLERLETTPSLAAKWHREQARGPYWQHGSICRGFLRDRNPLPGDRRLGRWLPQHALESPRWHGGPRPRPDRPLGAPLPPLRRTRVQAPISSATASPGGKAISQKAQHPISPRTASGSAKRSAPPPGTTSPAAGSPSTKTPRSKPARH